MQHNQLIERRLSQKPWLYLHVLRIDRVSHIKLKTHYTTTIVPSTLLSSRPHKERHIPLRHRAPRRHANIQIAVLVRIRLERGSGAVPAPAIAPRKTALVGALGRAAYPLALRDARPARSHVPDPALRQGTRGQRGWTPCGRGGGGRFDEECGAAAPDEGGAGGGGGWRRAV